MNAKEIANNAIAKAKTDWVKSMTDDFYADEKKNPLNIGAIGMGNTIIVTYADNVDIPLIGVAKCNPTDSYDKEVGIAIAYARAIGEDIPDYVLGTYEDEDEDDESDWDDEDEDDEDEDDEDSEYYVEFGKIGIGGKFIDYDNLFIKVSDDKAYCYNDKKTVDFDEGYVVDKIVTD